MDSFRSLLVCAIGRYQSILSLNAGDIFRGNLLCGFDTKQHILLQTEIPVAFSLRAGATFCANELRGFVTRPPRLSHQKSTDLPLSESEIAREKGLRGFVAKAPSLFTTEISVAFFIFTRGRDLSRKSIMLIRYEDAWSISNKYATRVYL